METASVSSGTSRTVETGRYWAGVVATALVAALVGVVGVLVLEKVFSVNLISQPTFFPSSDMGNYALAGALLALLAGLLAYVLVLSSPRPMAFFGWIMGLVTVVVAVLPLTWTADLTVALCTGALNLIVAVCAWSLTVQVTRRTVTRVRASTVVPGVPDAPGVAPTVTPPTVAPVTQAPYDPAFPQSGAPAYPAQGQAPAYQPPQGRPPFPPTTP